MRQQTCLFARVYSLMNLLAEDLGPLIKGFFIYLGLKKFRVQVIDQAKNSSWNINVESILVLYLIIYN